MMKSPDDGVIDLGLWTWGENNSGQLGIGSVTKRSSPVQVASLTNWDRITCGSYYTAAFRVP